MDDENPRPRKRLRHRKHINYSQAGRQGLGLPPLGGEATDAEGDDASSDHLATPNADLKEIQDPGEDVRFSYEQPSHPVPWQGRSWQCEDAFTELIRRWRDDIVAIHNVTLKKFELLLEIHEQQLDDENVEIVYKVKKPTDGREPRAYLGHVRFYGSLQGAGSVEIVTRGLNMETEFLDLAANPNSPASYAKPTTNTPKADFKFRDLKLEMAVLALMGDQGRHRVRIMTGKKVWNFKFAKSAEWFMSRLQHVDAEYRDWENDRIRLKETNTGEPSSDARPWEDTLITIGEPPNPGKRDKVYDSWGNYSKWVFVKEDEFREWTKTALFFHPSADPSDVDNSHMRLTGDLGDLIAAGPLLGRLYINGIQLHRWEFVRTNLNKDNLKYSYNMRKEMNDITTNNTVMSAEAEAKAIAAIWDDVIKLCDPMVAHLSSLLNTSGVPYRDALNIPSYLSKDTAVKLKRFLAPPLGGPRATPWYVSVSDTKTRRGQNFVATRQRLGFEVGVLADSYWELMVKFNMFRTLDKEMQRAAQNSEVHVDNAELSARHSPAVSSHIPESLTNQRQVPFIPPAASTRTTVEQTPPSISTRLSTLPVEDVTESSTEPVPYKSKDGPLRFPSAMLERQLSTDSVSTDLLAQTMFGGDNILLQRVQQVETELRASNQHIQQLLTDLQASKERETAMRKQVNGRPLRDLSRDVSVGHSSRETPSLPELLRETTSVVEEDDSPEERIFPVPTNSRFANEVMRLVQACLQFCPQPMNTYTCMPIEGGTGVVVAGFCRFDHTKRVLKFHKDWLLMERMSKDLGATEDTALVDLLVDTVLNLWSEVLNSELPNSFDRHDGLAVRARCRGAICRCLHGYRQAYIQMTVPERLRRHAELCVVTSNLANSSWADENDNIHISIHSHTCPWLQRSYATCQVDPQDRHFAEITDAEDPERRLTPVTQTSCSPSQSCHGVTNTGATRVPTYALRFTGLDYRKRYFVVARNLSRPESLIIIQDGLHYPQVMEEEDEDTPYTADWSRTMHKNLEEFVARGCVIQPMLRSQRRGFNEAAASPPRRHPPVQPGFDSPPQITSGLRPPPLPVGGPLSAPLEPVRTAPTRSPRSNDLTARVPQGRTVITARKPNQTDLPHALEISGNGQAQVIETGTPRTGNTVTADNNSNQAQPVQNATLDGDSPAHVVGTRTPKYDTRCTSSESSGHDSGYTSTAIPNNESPPNSVEPRKSAHKLTKEVISKMTPYGRIKASSQIISQRTDPSKLREDVLEGLKASGTMQLSEVPQTATDVSATQKTPKQSQTVLQEIKQLAAAAGASMAQVKRLQAARKVNEKAVRGYLLSSHKSRLQAMDLKAQNPHDQAVAAWDFELASDEREEEEISVKKLEAERLKTLGQRSVIDLPALSLEERYGRFEKGMVSRLRVDTINQLRGISFFWRRTGRLYNLSLPLLREFRDIALRLRGFWDLGLSNGILHLKYELSVPVSRDMEAIGLLGMFEVDLSEGTFELDEFVDDWWEKGTTRGKTTTASKKVMWRERLLESANGVLWKFFHGRRSSCTATPADTVKILEAGVSEVARRTAVLYDYYESFDGSPPDNLEAARAEQELWHTIVGLWEESPPMLQPSG